MAAIRQDMVFFGAEDWPLRYTILDATGAAKDLTNAVAVWVLKRTAEDTTEVLRRIGTLVTPLSGGQIDIPFYPADTIALLGAYYYELQVTLAGVRRKVAFGALSVRPTAIRDQALNPIPASYFGLHILDPNDVACVAYANCRATGQSWIHIEGWGSPLGGAPGVYDWRALDDQLTAATAAGVRLMYTTEKVPSFKTTLNGTITLGAASLAVASGAYSANGMYVLIDTEIVLITAGGGTNNWTVSRAQQGTTAASHTTGATVDIGVYYSAGVNTGPPNAAGLVAWSNFCAALVQRYKGKIEAYELYNEPEQTWTGTIGDFVAYTNVFHDAIRQYDPAALVVTPACQTVSYLDTFWAAGGTRDVDVVSFHGYPLLAAPVAETLDARKVTPLKTILATYGLSALPIWDSEASWGPLASLPVGDSQRAFLAIYYLLHWSLGVQRFYWYTWDDTLDGATVGYGALIDANKTNLLGAAITTSSATSVTLSAGANVALLANGSFVAIDGEAMKVTAGGGTTSLTVLRGQLGTTAAAHTTVGHNVSLLLAAAPAYWQVNNWMTGATMILPATVDGAGTWSMVFSRAGGYQALATWNSTTTVNFTPPGLYTKYRDLTGASTSISGTVNVGSLPLLFETS